ncbi:MAG: lysophospholipid acyltransferase family protein [Gemmatimonadota bacterium]
MKRLPDALLSALVWATWAILVIAWTPLVAVTYLATVRRDPGRRAAGRLFRRCAAVATRLNLFWNARIVGDRPAAEDHPFVVVCNHESLADVVLVGSVPWEMKWLSKESNFRIPFLGWMMRMAGDLRVQRDDPDSRAKAYDRLKEYLARGVSVMIFPEGTRSRTDELLPFRNGAFRLAIETGRPVLPLAVSGTRQSIRKGSLLFNHSRVVVRILPPVPVKGLVEEDIEPLRDRVRDLIDSARRGR